MPCVRFWWSLTESLLEALENFNQRPAPFRRSTWRPFVIHPRKVMMLESSVIVLCCLCFVIDIKLSSSTDSATAYVTTNRSQSILLLLLLYRVKDENGDSSTSQRLSTDAGHFAVASKCVQRIRPDSRRTITYVFSNLFPPPSTPAGLYSTDFD